MAPTGGPVASGCDDRGGDVRGPWPAPVVLGRSSGWPTGAGCRGRSLMGSARPGDWTPSGARSGRVSRSSPSRWRAPCSPGATATTWFLVVVGGGPRGVRRIPPVGRWGPPVGRARRPPGRSAVCAHRSGPRRWCRSPWLASPSRPRPTRRRSAGLGAGRGAGARRQSRCWPPATGRLDPCRSVPPGRRGSVGDDGGPMVWLPFAPGTRTRRLRADRGCVLAGCSGHPVNGYSGFFRRPRRAPSALLPRRRRHRRTARPRVA